RQVRLREVGGRAAQDLVLLLQQTDPLARFTQLDVLGRGRAGPRAVLDIGLREPVRQARFADAEVSSDLLQMDAWLAVPRNTHDVVAELLGVWLGHSAHPSSGASRHHRSDVTYLCSSPNPPGNPGRSTLATHLQH